MPGGAFHTSAVRDHATELRVWNVRALRNYLLDRTWGCNLKRPQKSLKESKRSWLFKRLNVILTVLLTVFLTVFLQNYYEFFLILLSLLFAPIHIVSGAAREEGGGVAAEARGGATREGVRIQVMKSLPMSQTSLTQTELCKVEGLESSYI